MNKSNINNAYKYFFVGNLDLAEKTCYANINNVNDKYQAYYLLAHIKIKKNNYTEAIEFLTECLKHNKYNIKVLNDLGVAYSNVNKFTESCNMLIKCLEISADSMSYNNLGNTFKDMGMVNDAIYCYNQALKLNPAHITAASNRYLCLHYITDTDKNFLFNVAKDWRKRINAKKRYYIKKQKKNKSKLSIGIISGNIRQHPVGIVLDPLINNSFLTDLNVTLYDNTQNKDVVNENIKNKVHYYNDISNKTDKSILDEINSDEQDILLDLSGHSSDSKMYLLTHRLATTQVKWIGGLFNTTGVPEVDHLIGDSYQIFKEDENYYVENIYRLPNDYICYAPPEYSPDVSALPAKKNKYITFGCFNNTAKINNYTIKLFSTILNNIQNCKLILKYRGYDDYAVREYILNKFKKFDTDANKIEFSGFSPHQKLLETYLRIDLSLDPYPYSGGITTCESLWMGVPVLTLPGPTFAGRHASSHLYNANLSQFIAKSEKDYINKAIYWSQHIDQLAELRKHMRNTMINSKLCDVSAFTNDFINSLYDIYNK